MNTIEVNAGQFDRAVRFADNYTGLSYQEIAHMTLEQFHRKVMDSHSKDMLVGGLTWTLTEFHARSRVYAIEVLAKAKQWHTQSAQPEKED